MSTSTHLPDLDDLVEESLESFDCLEDLLEESLAVSKEEAEAKAARKRRKQGGQSDAEKAEDAERIRRWELANEWKAVANVAVFKRFTCACGSRAVVFDQLMERQVHRHLRDSQRWQVVVGGAKLALPNESVYKEEKVTMCPMCAEQHGFSTEQMKEW